MDVPVAEVTVEDDRDVQLGGDLARAADRSGKRVALIASSMTVTPAFAGQTVASASVSGTVSDPSGVLPGATVRLRNG